MSVLETQLGELREANVASSGEVTSLRKDVEGRDTSLQQFKKEVSQLRGDIEISNKQVGSQYIQISDKMPCRGQYAV